MMIGNPPEDGTPLDMAQAAMEFFRERMEVFFVAASRTHQGDRVGGREPWLYDGVHSKVVMASTEWDHRNCALSWIRVKMPDVDRVWLVDTDEFYSDAEFELIRQAVEQTEADSWYINRETYWKTPLWKIAPPEPVHSCFCIDPRRVTAFTWIRTPHPFGQLLKDRECQKEVPLLVDGPKQHHLSAVRTDEGMARKLAAFSHAGEVVPGWFDRVWKGWTPEMEDLHPTHPANWKKAVPVEEASLPESVRRLIPALSVG